MNSIAILAKLKKLKLQDMQEDFSAVFIRANEQKSTQEQLRQRADSDSPFVFSSSRITMLYQVDDSTFAHLLCLFYIY